MLARESGKFGDAVDSVLAPEMRQQYVRRLLCEIARFMADDQTDIIDAISLSWLVEVALPHGDETDPEVVAMLKNRAGVVAFLANDDLPDYRRFAHSQLFNYFLSVDAIEAVANNEIPKYVRRNLFSADFIAVFADVFRHTADADPAHARLFFDRARKWALDQQSIDRGSRNLGAWLIAALPTIGDPRWQGAAHRAAERGRNRSQRNRFIGGSPWRCRQSDRHLQRGHSRLDFRELRSEYRHRGWGHPGVANFSFADADPGAERLSGCRQAGSAIHWRVARRTRSRSADG